MKYQVTFNVKESKKDSYDTFKRIISFPNIDKLAHAMDHLIRSILFEECSIILDSQQGWTFDIHNGEVTMDWRKVDVIKGQRIIKGELSLNMVLRPMGIALTSKSCNGYVGYVHYIGKTKAKRGTVDKSRTFSTYQKLLKFVQESKDILIMELTGREENILSNDEEKEIIRDILIETTTMDLSAMRDLTLNMDEIIEESEEEELMISGKQLGKMLEKQGVSEEECENFLAAYQTKLGNKGVHLSSLFDRRKMDIKTQEASVKVEMDRVFDIETRTVDGRVYLMIPLNNNVVEVNGVPVKGYDKEIDG